MRRARRACGFEARGGWEGEFSRYGIFRLYALHGSGSGERLLYHSLIMGQSFDITNSRDYLEELLVPSVEELHKQPTSTRVAITAAIFCWHLRVGVGAAQNPIEGCTTTP